MPTPRPRVVPPRRLSEVADHLGAPRPAGADLAVTGLTLDSRSVRPGDLYAALPGQRAHGASFAAAAVQAGAVAVLSDRHLDVGVPCLVVPAPRAVLGELASWLYGRPSHRLPVVGITGTNGKTTTAYLVEAGLAADGRRTGLVGTVETHLAGEVLPAERTTPEAPELQALLAAMVERGVTGVAMEVSSHALAQGRVDGVRFRVGVFTNLSQDHLDYHGGMEEYFAAKERLFDPGRLDHAVVNVEDPWGRRLAGRLAAAGGVELSTVSPTGATPAHWRGQDLVAGPQGCRLRALGPPGAVEVAVRLPGAFNAVNALLALVALTVLGVAPRTAAEGIAALGRVPGRMEVVEAGQPFTALVDYAHTPAAVATLLAALRPLTPGRLVVVLGCGGDRDRGKRPLMAQAAVAGADLAVFTSDNPRSEEPAAILAEMTAGLAPGGWQVEPDRARAVLLAAAGLGSGDTLVVAGKGHETGQEVAGRRTPLDDRELLRAAVARRPPVRP